jgi:hypothetical protein
MGVQIGLGTARMEVRIGLGTQDRTAWRSSGARESLGDSCWVAGGGERGASRLGAIVK